VAGAVDDVEVGAALARAQDLVQRSGERERRGDVVAAPDDEARHPQLAAADPLERRPTRRPDLLAEAGAGAGCHRRPRLARLRRRRDRRERPDELRDHVLRRERLPVRLDACRLLPLEAVLGDVRLDVAVEGARRVVGMLGRQRVAVDHGERADELGPRERHQRRDERAARVPDEVGRLVDQRCDGRFGVRDDGGEGVAGRRRRIRRVALPETVEGDRLVAGGEQRRERGPRVERVAVAELAAVDQDDGHALALAPDAGGDTRDLELQYGWSRRVGRRARRGHPVVCSRARSTRWDTCQPTAQRSSLATRAYTLMPMTAM
jgi:hypothetical protein